MKPRAACVTEGHKSPVSLPPPWPRTVWRKRIQSSLSSTLLNPIVCYWKWKQQSQTLTALICLGIAFEIALHLANQAIKNQIQFTVSRKQDHDVPQGFISNPSKAVISCSFPWGRSSQKQWWMNPHPCLSCGRRGYVGPPEVQLPAN